ncbi:MAG TPA: tetratricopeptide repeat protein [Tepidisphaeraceae bacterium]|nr:tetratricopeptide repeat protein [Tepidisphaeraceae bacterium]
MNPPSVTLPIDEAFRIGVQHQHAGRLAEAEEIYRQVLAQHPRNSDAHHLLGMVMHQAGKQEQAEKLIRQAIAIDPTFPQYHNNLGAVLVSSDKLDQATQAFQTALRLQPDYPDALSNLAMTRRQAGDSAAAVELLKKSLAISPNVPAIMVNLAASLNDLLRCEESIEVCKAVLRIDPRNTEIALNYGIALRLLERHEEAMNVYEGALRLRPDYLDAHWNLAHIQLSLGDFRRGWKSYEWRLKRKGWSGHPRFGQPRWTGEELGGKRILLHAEQGIGDCIQFLRYVPMVAQRGGRIIVACHKPLVRLLTGQLGIEEVWPEYDKIGQFDHYCALMSLPMVFDTVVETIPRNVPYLSCDSELAARWKEKLGDRHGEFRVGIVWAGRPEHNHDRWRSLRLEQFAPLASVKGVRFFSLQKGMAAAQARTPPPAMDLVDWTEDLHDFADTAALLAQMDLVIAVDTAVAHLAGAMGKPVWVLLPRVADWRWMLDRSETPWYPTMRLFRQEQHGNWQPVLRQVGEELQRLVSAFPLNS